MHYHNLSVMGRRHVGNATCCRVEDHNKTSRSFLAAGFGALVLLSCCFGFLCWRFRFVLWVFWFVRVKQWRHSCIYNHLYIEFLKYGLMIFPSHIERVFHIKKTSLFLPLLKYFSQKFIQLQEIFIFWCAVVNAYSPNNEPVSKSITRTQKDSNDTNPKLLKIKYYRISSLSDIQKCYRI